ncbi:ras-like GTP-binding protein rhoA [Dendronephthya gigantea]|uniref:ras-like GTP-binding protein rhoA n=1 Tax=Dendronephthya gigantea TaxID=151771 RepID=UPI0010692F8F|nr:ras-like GTP-binding protein rhoA [Dendronephthya gigantea]
MAPRELKMVAVGEGSCGKTCLLVGFARNEFPRDYVHTIFNTYTTQMTLNKQSLKLSLWDTAGNPDYDRIRPMAYPETDVFLLCFALDCPDSFINIRDKWIPEIRHFCPKTPVILVGTKKDLQCNKYSSAMTVSTIQGLEQTSSENGRHLAKQLAVYDYLECSARTMAGMREVFETAVQAAQYSAKKRKQERKRRQRCTIL